MAEVNGEAIRVVPDKTGSHGEGQVGGEQEVGLSASGKTAGNCELL